MNYSRTAENIRHKQFTIPSGVTTPWASPSALAELNLVLGGTRIHDEEAARHEWSAANLGGSADFMLFAVAD